MMNIEQLAREQGITITHNGYAGETDLLNVETAKAFAKAFAKALQQQSEPVKCMVCGYGILFCDTCGTGIYSPQKQQQSEPVAELANDPIFVYSHYMAKIITKNDAHPRTIGLVKGTKLYTQPPNTVSLEQYNKLLDAFKATRQTLDVANESGGQISDTIWHTYTQTLFDFMDEAIAEAERSAK